MERVTRKESVLSKEEQFLALAPMVLAFVAYVSAILVGKFSSKTSNYRGFIIRNLAEGVLALVFITTLASLGS